MPYPQDPNDIKNEELISHRKKYPTVNEIKVKGPSEVG